MIQEIPYKYDPAYKDKKPELTDYLLHYEYNKVMLLKEKEGYVIPTFQDLLSEEDCREKAYYLFSIGERGFYLVDDLKVPVLQEARSTVGEKAGGSAAAVAQR